MSNINTIESMRILRAVVEFGNYSAAAKHLNLSPAWVSKAIDRLESHLGVILFQRTTREMKITDSGEQCYKHGLELISLWDHMECVVRNSHVIPKGKIRVSIPMSWGLTCFSKAMSTFIDQYPDITLDIQMDDKHINLLKEDIDVALRLTGSIQDSSLLCRKVTSYRRILCATPEYITRYGEPDHPSKLVLHRCLLYKLPGQPGKWTFYKEDESFEVNLAPSLISNNSLLLHKALVSHQGIAFIPEFIVQDDLDNGNLLPLMNEYNAEPLYLYVLRPRHKKASNRLRAFQEFIVEYFGS